MTSHLSAPFQPALISIKNLSKHVVFITQMLADMWPESCLCDSVFSSVYAI